MTEPAASFRGDFVGSQEPGGQHVASITAGSMRADARDISLDVVKGICVIAMIVYHSIRYFPESALGLKYVGFVTGAFIFLAGYVATSVYRTKYNPRQQWPMISRRLAVRGAKLVLLAAVLNLLIATLLPRGVWKQVPGFGTLLFNLLTGTDYNSVSFVLLVAIGYCLVAEGALMAVTKGRTIPLALVAGASVVYAVVSNHFHWRFDYYARLFAIGQLGAALGLLDRRYIMKASSAFEAVLLLYLVQIFLMIFCPPGYFLYLINVIATLLVAYSLAAKFDSRAVLSRKLILLGKYSLLSYLFQIAFLHALRLVGDFTDEWVAGVIVLTSLATLGCVELTERLRKKSQLLEIMYRWVFC